MFQREDRGSTAVIRFAHGKVSALDADFCAALTAEIVALESSDSTSLVLTGTGSTFSAGVDLFAVLKSDDTYVGRFLPAMDEFFRALLTFPKPLVAAVNGHAIAGGCIVASACDYRVMAEGRGGIGIPELIVGVPFPALPFEIMASRLTPQVLRDLVFSGRIVSGPDVVRCGLIDEVAPADEVLDRALQHAERLARIPPATFELTKRAFAALVLHHVGLAAANAPAVLDTWRSDAVHQSIQQYLSRTINKRA
jgi:enoyl-CoA hydratase